MVIEQEQCNDEATSYRRHKSPLTFAARAKILSVAVSRTMPVVGDQAGSCFRFGDMQVTMLASLKHTVEHAQTGSRLLGAFATASQCGEPQRSAGCRGDWLQTTAQQQQPQNRGGAHHQHKR